MLGILRGFGHNRSCGLSVRRKAVRLILFFLFRLVLFRLSVFLFRFAVFRSAVFLFRFVVFRFAGGRCQAYTISRSTISSACWMKLFTAPSQPI